ncbi:MAG: hypothetical protein HYZ47_02090 [Simkania negevensis]|nr:hypothetical protein [Simkania negevensis]
MRQFIIFFTLLIPLFLQGEVIRKEGGGYIENREGNFLVYLEGNPYERGYQHGTLLKEKIQWNIMQFLEREELESHERYKELMKQFDLLLEKYIPSHFIQEMEGIADGSGISFEKIALLNFFPEMFHCTGMTLNEEATKDRSLYHVRVLDYKVGMHLQHTAVLMVVKPEGKIPYLNVSYAGFVGSVTGMNREKIAIGEIGGDGYGAWEGIPMGFLIREILENAQNLKEAKKILEEGKRTCEYYYVISDGKSGQSLGFYATPSLLETIHPGEKYAFINPKEEKKTVGKDNKLFLTFTEEKRSKSQVILQGAQGEPLALIHQQPKHTLILRGFGYPERYPILIDEVEKHYGKIDALALQEMIKLITNETNLHNAIFHPSTLEAWISHAGKEKEGIASASQQPYHHYKLSELLK